MRNGVPDPFEEARWFDRYSPFDYLRCSKEIVG
jgi:hypothetical protein